MDSFNLLDKPWIPVLRHDGTTQRLGIVDALDQAGQIRQIAAPNPMDRVALLRFLLALLYSSYGNPPAQDERDRILANGRFPAEWLRKLEQRNDFFNLLGNRQRFYQNSASPQRTLKHTANYLIHEVPSGTNKWHFRHVTDYEDGLCPACCAMGLIRLPVFATSAGKGKSPGINSKPPLYVLPWGPSLLATLLLSWQPRNHELGTPGWETPGQELPQSGVVPLLTGMTWSPRNVWLGEPQSPESICASCGRQDRLIRRCVFDGNGTSKAAERVWEDPHVVYAKAKNGLSWPLQTSDALGNSDAAAGQWAGRFATILRDKPLPRQCALWVVGFCTVQNDKYLEATESFLWHPGTSRQAEDLAAALERWQKEGMSLARRSRPKSSSRKHVEIRSALDAVRSHVEVAVATDLDNRLRRNQQAWDSPPATYGPMMEVIAAALSPGFTTQAVQRRTQITNTIPNMKDADGK